MRLGIRLLVWVSNAVLAVSLAGVALLRLGPPPWHFEFDGVKQPSILDASDDTVRVRLLDAATGRPLARVPDSVDGVQVVLCSTPPCPPLRTHWAGRTDAIGWIALPRTVIGNSTMVRTPAHGGDI